MVQDENINIVIFGGNNKNYYPEIDFKGFIILTKLVIAKFLKNCIMLELTYGLFPSKMETFGQTAIRSLLACGTPVVAFTNTGSNSDIVEHKENGYLS